MRMLIRTTALAKPPLQNLGDCSWRIDIIAIVGLAIVLRFRDTFTSPPGPLTPSKCFHALTGVAHVFGFNHTQAVLKPGNPPADRPHHPPAS